MTRQFLAIFTDRRAQMAHYATLLLAFVGLVWYTRRQYFTEDDWEFIDRLLPGVNRLGLFAPHNEHWSTIPILLYKLLFAVVGLKTYVPYMAVLIGLHVLTAHLLWRIMLRTGADAWIATTLAAIFLVLGSGAENITWAFQIGFVGSLAAGCGMVLAVLVRTRMRLLLSWLLGVISIMCSGLGPIMVVVAAFTALLLWGWRRAALTAIVPAVVYACWWLVYPIASTTPGARHLLLNIPAYMFTGLTSAAAGITGLKFVGALLVIPLLAWLLLRTRRARENAVVIAMAAGVPLFFFVVGLGRVALGVDEAKSSRYVYITAVLLLAPIAVALTAAARRHVLVLGLVCVGLLAAGLRNAGDMVTAVRALTPVRQHAEARILAAARLVHGSELIVGGAPETTTAPNLTWVDLVQLVDLHDVPNNSPVPLDDLDRATLAANLQMSSSANPLLPVDRTPVASLAATSINPAVNACTRVSATTSTVLPRVLLSFTTPASVLIRVDPAATVTAFLYVPAAVSASPPHTILVDSTGTVYLDVSAPAGKAVVELPATGGTICGVSEPGASAG